MPQTYVVDYDLESQIPYLLSTRIAGMAHYEIWGFLFPFSFSLTTLPPLSLSLISGWLGAHQVAHTGLEFMASFCHSLLITRIASASHLLRFSTLFYKTLAQLSVFHLTDVL